MAPQSVLTSVIPPFSVYRKEWLTLKGEYLNLQKRSMASLKRCINKIDHKESRSVTETDKDAQDGNGELRPFLVLKHNWCLVLLI